MQDHIIAELSKISAAAVADVLRSMGYRNQVLDPGIKPVISGLVLCGRSHTHRNLPYRKQKQPSAIVRESQEHFQPGEVVVEGYWGAWGFVFSKSAQVKGCVGVVVDGGCRDLAEHRTQTSPFPVFCRLGLSLGRPERSSNPGGSHRGWPTRFVAAYNVPINCGGVLVNPRDIVLGNDDGVVIIPNEIEEAVLRFATEYEQLDNQVADALQAGKSVKEAYRSKSNWQKTIGLTSWLKARNME